MRLENYFGSEGENFSNTSMDIFTYMYKVNHFSENYTFTFECFPIDLNFYRDLYMKFFNVTKYTSSGNFQSYNFKYNYHNFVLLFKTLKFHLLPSAYNIV